MASKEFICIVCPRGCRLTVDDNLAVSGNLCPRGAVYGRQEATNPVRVLTTSVRVINGVLPLCPVKTSQAVPKSQLLAIMSSINDLEASAPIHIGQVLAHNIGETGADLVATRNIERLL
jgi:CxxC motif-containing protein